MTEGNDNSNYRRKFEINYNKKHESNNNVRTTKYNYKNKLNYAANKSHTRGKGTRLNTTTIESTMIPRPAISIIET